MFFVGYRQGVDTGRIGMQIDIDPVQALAGCAGEPAHFFAGQIGDFYVVTARCAGIEKEAGRIAGGIGVSIECDR